MTISKSKRQQIMLRAKYCCEYCRLHQDYGIKKYEVDHIIPKKHGGEDLAWACFHCNRYKGSDVAAFDIETGELAPLFNPRKQIWHEHFSLSDEGEIIALTSTGRVTILVLQFNRPSRIQVRKLLIDAELYP